MLSRGHVSLAAWAAALLALVVPGGSAADLTPTRADVSYGPHASNTLDFWQAAGEGPRPLLVNIHGGGWLGGDKRVDSKQIQPYLDRGVSYASINYRHTNQAPLPAPVHDAARAVQFLKSQATAWQLNKDRIGLIGLSAGACTSMWLLLHDDLADPTASDPVLRESTRVRAAVAVAGQTSIDPPVIESWLGPSVLKHRMISMAVGEPRIEEAPGQLRAAPRALRGVLTLQSCRRSTIRRSSWRMAKT